jgi:hypothetical protein
MSDILEVHPWAGKLPLMPENEFEELKADILKNDLAKGKDRGGDIVRLFGLLTSDSPFSSRPSERAVIASVSPLVMYKGPQETRAVPPSS